MPIFIQSGRFGIDPSSALTGWDFSDAASVTLNAGDVSQVNDTTPNARHWVQATGARQPLYVSAAQNGLNVARFNGTSDTLACAGVNGTAAPCTLIYAFKLITAAADKTMMGGLLFSYTQAGGAANHSAFGTAAVNSSTVADTNAHVLSIVFNGASSTIRLDGTQIASGNTGTLNAVGLFMANDSVFAKPTNMDHMQGWLFGSALSVSNQQYLEALLKAKWATT